MYKKFTITFFILVALMQAYASAQSLGSGDEGTQARGDAVAAEEAEKKDYDLSALPEDLREKVELYLKQKEELEKDAIRLDSMLKASGNAWAQSRATGMATKLNYEIKQLRVTRREIVREYRELLRDGWTPPDSVGDFENLFFGRTDSKS